MPKVSVLTATYEHADVLPRAIESLRAGTFEDYEHIIIDDGSSDDPEAVVATYADDSRVTYVPLECNQGPAVALNTGVELARGEYLSFLDADDEYLPRRLEVTTGALDDLGDAVGGVCHSMEKLRRTGNTVHAVPGGVIRLADLAEYNHIQGNSNTMYRASAFEHVGGFDERLMSSIDYDLQLRVLEEYSLFGIEEVLCRYDATVDGIGDDAERKRRGLERLLEKHSGRLSERNLSERHRWLARACLTLGDEDQAHRHAEASIETSPPAYTARRHSGLGRDYLEHGHKSTGRHHLAKSLRLDPWNYEAYALFVASLLPVDGRSAVTRLRSLREFAVR